MRYVFDHDYHIHSFLSSCSSDPNQLPEAILQYARENGLKRIVITDHFWDSDVPGASNWYAPQNYLHISQSLPLPQAEGIEFLFGCETDMDKFFTVGVADQNLDKFDFIIVPTTHLHMGGFTLESAEATVEERAELYVKRLDALLDKNLPFEKIGIAHLTCSLIAPGDFENHMKVLDLIPDETFVRLFKRVQEKGAGVELNMDIFKYAEKDLDRVLRVYRIAKSCGCKFYIGSDAHSVGRLQAEKKNAERIIALLELEESDKFTFPLNKASVK